MRRREFLALTGIATAAAACALPRSRAFAKPQAAASYPAGTVTIVSPFTAGGTTDDSIAARAAATVSRATRRCAASSLAPAA